jgi:hypothetical protein
MTIKRTYYTIFFCETLFYLICQIILDETGCFSELVLEIEKVAES